MVKSGIVSPEIGVRFPLASPVVGVFMVQLRSPHLIDHAKWVEWMNDKEINRFLESRFTLYTLEDCRKWEVSWDQSKTHSIWDGKIFVGMASVYDVAPFHDVGGLSILPLLCRLLFHIQQCPSHQVRASKIPILLFRNKKEA